MISARFMGGAFDGAEMTITERMPTRITIEIECHDVNTDYEAFREAFFANLEVEPSLGQAVFCRNARALHAEYVLHDDEFGAPFFKFEGWAVDGVSESND